MRERDDVENDSDDENVPNQRNDNHQNQDDIQVYMLPESIQRRRVEGQLVRRNMMNRMLPR